MSCPAPTIGKNLVLLFFTIMLDKLGFYSHENLIIATGKKPIRKMKWKLEPKDILCASIKTKGSLCLFKLYIYMLFSKSITSVSYWQPPSETEVLLNLFVFKQLFKTKPQTKEANKV